ncbi:MAG: hypothetical protein IIC67_07455, partial [Thaumarchaeota archaeon]|nr:hypothetical protein [Nitrososphaerota archaeon]
FARTILDKLNNDCEDITGPSEQEQTDCSKSKGYVEYRYNEFNCPTSWTCQTCGVSYNEAQKEHNYLVFIVSSILGLIAIALALYLPLKKNHLNQWISTGFMLGGLITLFIGTIRFFSELGRFVRPVVILAELIIVIYIAYKKIKK